MLLPHDRLYELEHHPVNTQILGVHDIYGISSVMHSIVQADIEIVFGDELVVPDNDDDINERAANIKISCGASYPAEGNITRGLFNSALSAMQVQDVWVPIKSAERMDECFEVGLIDQPPQTLINLSAVSEDGQFVGSHIYVFGEELSDEGVENVAGLFDAIIQQGVQDAARYDTTILMVPAKKSGLYAAPGNEFPGVCSSTTSMVTQEMLQSSAGASEILSSYRSMFLPTTAEIEAGGPLVMKQFARNVEVSPYNAAWGIKVPSEARLVRH